MQVVSTFFWFVLWFFLNFAERHCLFKCLAHFIQALVVQVMDTFGPFGIQVDQLVVITHGLAYVVAGMAQ